MATMAEITTLDKRVDELSKRVDRGFEQTDQRIDDLRSEMYQGFNRVDGDIREIRSDIGSLQKLMIGFFATTLGSIIAGVALLFLSHH
jgi:tetrahydromethanopterin S-methyltransferase subunit G